VRVHVTIAREKRPAGARDAGVRRMAGNGILLPVLSQKKLADRMKLQTQVMSLGDTQWVFGGYTTIHIGRRVLSMQGHSCYPIDDINR
jgi:hypothetical protein